MLSLILVIVMALQGAAIGAESEPARSKPLASTLDGYVLQVGAFQDKANAQGAVAKIGGRQTYVLPTRREQQDWYVVIYDNYVTRESAELDAQKFSRDFPGWPFWIRKATELKINSRMNSSGFEPPAFTLDGYVLQVGAFPDPATAQRAIAEISGGRMFIVPIRDDQQDWYVVLYDNFSNRRDAELAAWQFKRDFPRHPAWVRDAAQLRKLLRFGSAGVK